MTLNICGLALGLLIIVLTIYFERHEHKPPEREMTNADWLALLAIDHVLIGDPETDYIEEDQ